MFKTIEELKNECVRIFGLDHWNTKSFFDDCEIIKSVNYMNEKLNEMKMFQKINECEIAHVMVRLSTDEIVTVELVNKSFDFYASAFMAIKNAIDDKYFGIEYIEILDIITD